MQQKLSRFPKLLSSSIGFFHSSPTPTSPKSYFHSPPISSSPVVPEEEKTRCGMASHHNHFVLVVSWFVSSTLKKLSTHGRERVGLSAIESLVSLVLLCFCMMCSAAAWTLTVTPTGRSMQKKRAAWPPDSCSSYYFHINASLSLTEIQSLAVTDEFRSGRVCCFL